MTHNQQEILSLIRKRESFASQAEINYLWSLYHRAGGGRKDNRLSFSRWLKANFFVLFAIGVGFYVALFIINNPV